MPVAKIVVAIQYGRHVLLRYNYRIYPSPSQAGMLSKTFGCARVVYNDAILQRRAVIQSGETISYAQLQRKVITEAKRTPERAWLVDVSSDALVQALQDLRTAYRRFFDSRSGGAKKQMGMPDLRSRKAHRQSVRFTRNGFVLRGNGRLYLAKIGEIEVRWSRNLPSAPSSVTVIRDRAGRYFASFVVSVDPAPGPLTQAEVGIDLGLSRYAVTSDGVCIENPRFLRRSERKLRQAHRELARKTMGSKNRAKARLKLARRHAKVADSRRNWLHQQTSRLIRDNQAIYLEDLAVKGLSRTRLAKSIHDASWGSFRRMLEAKAARYGRYIGVIGRFVPSTQICSTCGKGGGRKPLDVRVWTCRLCGTKHDRDHNAAKNILAAGRAERLNACGGARRPETAMPYQACSDEAGTHLCEINSHHGRSPSLLAWADVK